MQSAECGICILAGGLSSRMGVDKSKLRIGRRTMLGHVRTCARQLGLSVRVIRRDLLPRCGPLGGVYTGLKTSHHAAELFLSSDMPFVSVALLSRLVACFERRDRAVFIIMNKRFGFPFLVPANALPIVEREIRTSRFSIQNLARKLRAWSVRIPATEQNQLLNINTREDFARAIALHRMQQAGRKIT